MATAKSNQDTIEHKGQAIRAEQLQDNNGNAIDVATLAAIPETDQEDSETIWNDNGVLKVSGSGS